AGRIRLGCAGSVDWLVDGGAGGELARSGGVVALAHPPRGTLRQSRLEGVEHGARAFAAGLARALRRAAGPGRDVCGTRAVHGLRLRRGELAADRTEHRAGAAWPGDGGDVAEGYLGHRTGALRARAT